MFFNLPLISIDIGSSAIKIVEMSGKNDKKLRTIGIELLPEGVIQDGIIRDIATVENTLKHLIRRLKIRTTGRRTSISLGGNSVIIKKINYPNKDDLELADMIESEAEQHFQHDINDLYFTWHALDTDPDNPDRPVILIGAKRDLVEQYISVIKSTGLKIGVVDCDVFALYNMFEYNFGSVSGLVALANIGASSTQVTLIGNGQYLYTRDIAIGGNNYSKSISSALNISLENAEAMKIAAGEGDPSAGIADPSALNKVTDQLVSEIQVTTDFFFQSGEAPMDLTAVSAVFLSGGGAKTPGLDSSIASSLNIPVNMINPFHKVEIPKRFPMESVLSQGHLYSVCVGLSLREVDDHV